MLKKCREMDKSDLWDIITRGVISLWVTNLLCWLLNQIIYGGK